MMLGRTRACDVDEPQKHRDGMFLTGVWLLSSDQVMGISHSLLSLSLLNVKVEA